MKEINVHRTRFLLPLILAASIAFIGCGRGKNTPPGPVSSFGVVDKGVTCTYIKWKEGLAVMFLDPMSGNVIARVPVPDIIDTDPALYGGRLFFPSWDRRVRAVDVTTGKVIGQISWTESPADDHRQASPLIIGDRLIFGLWNGDLRALDPEKL